MANAKGLEFIEWAKNTIVEKKGLENEWTIKFFKMCEQSDGFDLDKLSTFFWTVIKFD